MVICNKAISFIALCTYATVPSWAFQVPTRNVIRNKHRLSMSSGESLPSAYDLSLPAGLRGEAVRSALKSDRGTCIDFTSLESVKNVGVVQVSGKGTGSFLNNKLSNTFPEQINEETTKHGGDGFEVKVDRGFVKEAGLLNSKGRIIDKLTVATFGAANGIEAYMITSPGHGGSQLFDRLDPLIFPMDGVKLVDMCPTHTSKSKDESKVLTFAATSIEVVQNCIRQSVLPVFDQWDLHSIFSFPTNEEGCIRYALSGENLDDVEIVIFEQKALPQCVSRGYTILISDRRGKSDDSISLGSKVWNACVAESNFNGPVKLGPLEYETLRIEGGQPAFLLEMTGSLKDGDERNTKASPLELYLDNAVDVHKGCYQGQEGLAALLKNKRGLPRTLYSVSFAEEDNLYEGQDDEEEYSNHPQRIPNETKLPKVGDELFALGSNQQIKVGTITSIAERGGTSFPETIGMALIKRADPILKKMKAMDLEIERDVFMPNDMESGNGIIMPPPMDPLGGLEVVLKNGFTRGQLRVIPSRRLRMNQNMFEVEQLSAFDDGQGDTGATMGFMQDGPAGVQDEVSTSTDILTAPEAISSVSEMDMDMDSTSGTMNNDIEDGTEDDELHAAIEAATAAADEARRKEEKLAKLKERAEEALKKRKEAKAEAAKSKAAVEEKEIDENTAEAEGKRKAEKMEMLKKRAEEAMARRRKTQ
jgi:folate-binding Fe-S cluster repair protein YgfZ